MSMNVNSTIDNCGDDNDGNKEWYPPKNKIIQPILLGFGAVNNGPTLSPFGLPSESPSAVPSMAQLVIPTGMQSASQVRVHFMVEKINSSGVVLLMVQSLYNRMGYQGEICRSSFGDFPSIHYTYIYCIITTIK